MLSVAIIERMSPVPFDRDFSSSKSISDRTFPILSLSPVSVMNES